MATSDHEVHIGTGKKEEFLLPDGVEGEQREVFEELYTNRLQTALENTAAVLERLTTRQYNDTVSFHDNADEDFNTETFKKPLFELYAFPFRTRFGAKTGLLTSKAFTRLATMSKLYPVTVSEFPTGDPQEHFIHRIPFFAKKYKQKLYLGRESRQEESVLDKQEKVSFVGEEMEMLADSIDVHVRKEMQELNKQKDVQRLIGSVAVDIAANLTIDTDDDSLLQRLPDLVELYLRTHPKAEARILEQVATYLGTRIFDRKAPQVQSCFPQSELIAFEQWLHVKLSSGKKKEHDLSVHFAEEPVPMSLIEQQLRAIKLEDTSTVYDLPTKQFMETLTLPTKWFKRGTWILHWSKNADVFRSIGERLSFMGSDVAVDKLAFEPGVPEGLATIAAADRLQASMRRCTYIYNQIGHGTGWGERVLPYLSEPRGDAEYLIQGLLKKDHSFDYENAISLAQSEIEHYVQQVETFLAQQNDNMQVIRQRLEQESGNLQLRSQLASFDEFSTAVTQDVRAVRETTQSLVDTLNRDIEVTLEDPRFTRPSFPETMGDEGERMPGVALPIDYGTKHPRIEAAVQEPQATRAVTLDDIISEMGIVLEQDPNEKRKRD